MICAENSIFICISLCRRMKKRFSLLANNRNSNDTIIFVQKTAPSQHDYALSVLRMCGNPLKGVRMIFVELIFLTIRSIPLSPSELACFVFSALSASEFESLNISSTKKSVSFSSLNGCCCCCCSSSKWRRHCNLYLFRAAFFSLRITHELACSLTHFKHNITICNRFASTVYMCLCVCLRFACMYKPCICVRAHAVK